jgi:hypothetical protein
LYINHQEKQRRQKVKKLIIISHTSNLGRQTAITIQQEKKVITIAIQEHGEDERVMITHMAVGS